MQMKNTERRVHYADNWSKVNFPIAEVIHHTAVDSIEPLGRVGAFATR